MAVQPDAAGSSPHLAEAARLRDRARELAAQGLEHEAVEAAARALSVALQHDPRNPQLRAVHTLRKRCAETADAGTQTEDAEEERGDAARQRIETKVREVAEHLAGGAASGGASFDRKVREVTDQLMRAAAAERRTCADPDTAAALKHALSCCVRAEFERDGGKHAVVLPQGTVARLREAVHEAGGPPPHVQCVRDGRGTEIAAGGTLPPEVFVSVRRPHPATVVHLAAGPGTAAVLPGRVQQRRRLIQWGRRTDGADCDGACVSAEYTAVVVGGKVRVLPPGKEPGLTLSVPEDEIVVQCSAAAGDSLAAVTACGNIHTSESLAAFVPASVKGHVRAAAVGEGGVVIVTDSALHVCRKKTFKGVDVRTEQLSGKSVVSVSAGKKLYAAVLSDSSVVCRAFDGGRKGDGSVRDATHCSCGDDFAVVHRSCGKLAWFGEPGRCRLDGDDFVAVAAGPRFVVAEKKDMRLVVAGPAAGDPLLTPPRVR